MRSKLTVLMLAGIMILSTLTACGNGGGSSSDPEAAGGQKEATGFTAEKNQSWYGALDFDDESEKENALNGLIEAPESLVIRDDEGNVVWSMDDYDFVEEMEKAPDTANPSLWRNTLYNSYAGLFEVCDGIYQVRGYDMANATFIRTDNGWIVFDVLMCRQNMAEAKALMEKHFGKLDIKAVLYSHSHIDHYGGIYGLIEREDAADPSLSLKEQLASGKVELKAPKPKTNKTASKIVTVINKVANRYGVVTPSVVLLGGDYVGSGPDQGETGQPVFSLADLRAEIFSSLDPSKTDLFFTYGSHDRNCADGYSAFFSGPHQCDGYYIYGVSFAQMAYVPHL